MVKMLKALSNPIRLKMIASLCDKPKHLYALAKELNLPYPLAYLHLNGLKKLGLVKEIREEKKVKGLPSVKYYAPADFKLVLTPQSIRDTYLKRPGGERGG
jgi:ArsR family transcriptional regulator